MLRIVNYIFWEKIPLVLLYWVEDKFAKISGEENPLESIGNIDLAVQIPY